MLIPLNRNVMSLSRCYFQKNVRPKLVKRNDSTKLKVVDDVVNGVVVKKYEFVSEKSEDDPRQKQKYQDLCLGNLQRLGLADQLQRCMLYRDDVDLVVSQIDKLYEKPTQTPAQASQA